MDSTSCSDQCFCTCDVVLSAAGAYRGLLVLALGELAQVDFLVLLVIFAVFLRLSHHDYAGITTNAAPYNVTRERDCLFAKATGKEASSWGLPGACSRSMYLEPYRPTGHVDAGEKLLPGT
jgi:hypothetical protein